MGIKKTVDKYFDSYKGTPFVHKASMKYAISNQLIRAGTLAKFTFKKAGAKGGYTKQKQSFKKMMETCLNKKGLKISRTKCDKKTHDFETMSFSIVSK